MRYSVISNTPFDPPQYDQTNRLDRLLSPHLLSALKEMGISRLYRHQVDAIEAVHNGQDVVLETPTASGKTLGFTLPVFEMLIHKPNSHVLMIYPMKAVCNDQRRQIEDLAQYIPDPKIESWAYDGDTPDDERKIIRQTPPPILLTNPEMLNLSFLGHSEQWQKF